MLLLFLVGLELEPSRLWALRQPVFGLGGAQVLITGLALTGIAHAFDFSWQAAVVIGFGLAMSSTAIVLAWLGERGELSSPSGRRAFAILLFQDLAVIPLIALLPLLAPDKTGMESGWLLAAKGGAAIVLVIVVSRVLIRPALKLVARFGGREVFTAAALLVVIGAALLMEAIGLSMSLGAFLAGVLLADSEFRHELEADVEPFKGLLLGLFFMAVGMSANLALFRAHPFAVLGVALGMMAFKALLLYGIMRVAKEDNDDAQRIAGLLSQGGEFAFVLFTAAQVAGILAAETSQFLVLAVTISMLLAPLTFVAHEKLLERWLARRTAARIRSHRWSRQPGDHRGLRALRADRLARAAHGGHSVHGDRSELPAGRFRAQVRQQGVLRRRVTPRAARIGQGARREALRAGDRRRRGVGEDGGARAPAFPGSADSRPRAQSRALLPAARPRHRSRGAGDVPLEPRNRAPGAGGAGLRGRRGPRARSTSSASTTSSSSKCNTRCGRTRSN